VTRQHDARLLLVYVPIKYRVYRDSVELPARSALHRWTLWPLPALFEEF
jgi:hypothetical protein